MKRIPRRVVFGAAAVLLGGLGMPRFFDSFRAHAADTPCVTSVTTTTSATSIAIGDQIEITHTMSPGTACEDGLDGRLLIVIDTYALNKGDNFDVLSQNVSALVQEAFKLHYPPRISIMLATDARTNMCTDGFKSGSELSETDVADCLKLAKNKGGNGGVQRSLFQTAIPPQFAKNPPPDSNRLDMVLIYSAGFPQPSECTSVVNAASRFKTTGGAILTVPFGEQGSSGACARDIATLDPRDPGDGRIIKMIYPIVSMHGDVLNILLLRGTVWIVDYTIQIPDQFDFVPNGMSAWPYKEDPAHRRIIWRIQEDTPNRTLRYRLSANSNGSSTVASGKAEWRATYGNGTSVIEFPVVHVGDVPAETPTVTVPVVTPTTQNPTAVPTLETPTQPAATVSPTVLPSPVFPTVEAPTPRLVIHMIYLPISYK